MNQYQGLMDQNAAVSLELDSDLPSWSEAAGYVPCEEAEAVFLVVGTGEISYGICGTGILAYCVDEISAWRCRREILKDTRAEAMVLLNTPETREAIDLVLRGILRETGQEDSQESFATASQGEL